MDTLIAAGATAIWLGILTSISPCPLATNIAAISFIGKRLGSTSRVLGCGVFYTLGRMAAYVALAGLLVAGVLSVPGAANFLQKYMNKLLGPVLIVTGMVLLELIQFNVSASLVGRRVQARAERGGIWGAGLLGVVFALSFCPVSAALFFGSLIALSIRHGSRVLLPSLYGVGTGLPVIVFAVLLALGAQSLAKAFNKLARVECWARWATGGILVIVGVYFCFRYIFCLFPI